jgi:hypothetical protein
MRKQLLIVADLDSPDFSRPAYCFWPALSKRQRLKHLLVVA